MDIVKEKRLRPDRNGVLLLSMVALACYAKPFPMAGNSGSHEAEIYAIALDSLLGSRAGPLKRRTYVLNDSTESFHREELVPEFWTELLAVSGGDSSLVKAFENASRTRHSLRPIATDIRSRLNAPLELVADSALVRVRMLADSLRRADATYPQLAEGYWRAFYRLFPNSHGSTTVSAIGYSQDGTRALLFVSHGCGELCGQGKTVLLHRTLGQWRISRIAMLWVS
jgi:hypothetical protein